MRRVAIAAVLAVFAGSCGGTPRISGEIFVGDRAGKSLDVFDGGSFERVAPSLSPAAS